MKIFHKLLFLSISLITYGFINSVDEKPGEGKKPIELKSLTSIIAEKLANKALKDYTDAYEKDKNYNNAYEAFTNSLKEVPEHILFEEIYCYLINDEELDRADIFIRQLAKEFENSNNDQEKNEKVLQFYLKFCPEAQAEIIYSIIEVMDKKLADIPPTTLENLAIYLTENLHDMRIISSLEDNLEFLSKELSSEEEGEEKGEAIELKLNLMDQLFKILDQKHATLVHEKLVEFPQAIQEKGRELLELYKANNMVKFKNAINELSNEIKHKILMFYLENYLVSNNNFEAIINIKKEENLEISASHILYDLIYYLSPLPVEILLKPESQIDFTDPSEVNDAKAANNIFANLYKELSSVYPKTADSIYADIYHFLPHKEVEIKNPTSLISKILNDYIYWSGLEFKSYIKNKEVKQAADLILEFYNNVKDIRPLIFLLEELLSAYILPLGEEKLIIKHINTFIEILKEIKFRKIFDQFIYNKIIDGIIKYTYNEYDNENLKPRGLTETQLDNLLDSLKI